jgi:hypothetical protein
MFFDYEISNESSLAYTGFHCVKTYVKYLACDVWAV